MRRSSCARASKKSKAEKSGSAARSARRASCAPRARCSAYGAEKAKAKSKKGKMDYIPLGRTGLKASVAGLGCGGPSRLGLRDNKSEKECAALVRQAFDLGVNFLDTAEVYGTEEIVGQALAALPREQVIISTKMKFPPDDKRDPPGEVRKSLERSLKSLGTDYVDIYHVHGVEPGEYEFAATEILPALLRLREEGKVRFIGVTGSHDDLKQNIESLNKPFLPAPAVARLKEIFAQVDCVTGN